MCIKYNAQDAFNTRERERDSCHLTLDRDAWHVSSSQTIDCIVHAISCISSNFLPLIDHYILVQIRDASLSKVHLCTKYISDKYPYVKRHLYITSNVHILPASKQYTRAQRAISMTLSLDNGHATFGAYLFLGRNILFQTRVANCADLLPIIQCTQFIHADTHIYF